MIRIGEISRMIRTLRTLSAEQILSHVIYGIRGHTSARLRPKHPPEMTTGGALVPFLKGPAHAMHTEAGLSVQDFSSETPGESLNQETDFNKSSSPSPIFFIEIFLIHF